MAYEIDIHEFEDAAYQVDADPRAEYSGRGMYGTSCVGIVCDGPAGLILFVCEMMERDAGHREWLPGVRSDSMGHQTIYYWPSVLADYPIEA